MLLKSLGSIAAVSLMATGLVACGSSDNGPMGGTPDATVPDVDNPYPGSENTWRWVPIAGTTCMDGSSTGMGVNYRPGSTKLMIYLEGGGACFNPFTCSGVAHQNGFGEAELTSFANEFGGNGVFNREDRDNPLSDYSFVFVPYCTGDIFAGNNESGFGGRQQVGYRNMGLYTEELVRTFGPQIDHVVLSGSSAGGFGAAYNFDRVQTAFGSTPVTLLDDSGPPLSDDYLTPCLQQQVRDSWGLADTLPSDCTDCTTQDGGGLSNFTTFLAEKYTDRKFGMITSTTDGVIRLFYGWGYPNCQSPQVPMNEDYFAQGIAELEATAAGYDNLDVYVIESGLHVWLLENPVGSTVVDSVKITDWIRTLLP